jgi:hypothetical protein
MSKDTSFNYDPFFQGMTYIQEMGTLNALNLVGHELNQQQLQKVSPVITHILSDYKSRKPFAELPDKVKEEYKTEKDFLSTKYDVDKTAIGHVQDFLANVAKAVGPEKTLEKLRNGSKNPTMEEMEYAAAIIALAKFEPSTGLTSRELEIVSSAVGSANKILGLMP